MRSASGCRSVSTSSGRSTRRDRVARRLGASGSVDGYEQFGVVHGEVLLGRSRFELDAVGLRSHTWGVPRFDRAAAPRGSRAGAHLELRRGRTGERRRLRRRRTARPRCRSRRSGARRAGAPTGCRSRRGTWSMTGSRSTSTCSGWSRSRSPAPTAGGGARARSAATRSGGSALQSGGRAGSIPTPSCVRRPSSHLA